MMSNNNKENLNKSPNSELYEGALLLAFALYWYVCVSCLYDLGRVVDVHLLGGSGEYQYGAMGVVSIVMLLGHYFLFIFIKKLFNIT